MNDIMKDLTSVGMAIIGVAILAVIVSSKNNTTQVISSATHGFASVLGVAMGGTAPASVGLG